VLQSRAVSAPLDHERHLRCRIATGPVLNDLVPNARTYPMSLFLVVRSFYFAAMVATAGLTADAASRPAVPADSDRPASVVLTTVAAASASWPNLRADDTAVRIEGVVTGTMPSGAFRLHDGDMGIYVTKSVDGLMLKPGDRVVVSGVLRSGGFSPWLSPHEVVTLGKGSYPEARPASYHLLASGAADNQWLEIEGVVRAVDLPAPRDFAILDLAMMSGNLRVLVNYDSTFAFEPLIDAAVRLKGVAAVNVNKHGHVVEPSFRVPSFAEIDVLEPAQADVFARPLVRVQGLIKVAQGSRFPHRVRTGGVVTRRLSETRFFVRDGELGLKVETALPVDFRPGDVIEAAGFPVMSDGQEVLQYAVSRKVGSRAPPAPVRATIAEVLEGGHSSDLVDLRARLVDRVVAGRNVTLVFQSQGHIFKGLLIHDGANKLTLPEKNSLVDVAGICVINELEDIWFYQPRSFLLLVAELADLRVVEAPSWWTAERLWRALAITGVVLLAAAGWVWALRRQIGRKRAVIEQQARHAAALEERGRIARELHDTLEQGLTGLSLQMKAMETDLAQAPERVHSRLQFARQMLRHSRALARNAIRELRSEMLPTRHEGLIDGLNRVANSWNCSGALAVEVRVIGKVRPLPARLEQHLLRIGTEAMTNAVKHGRAETIVATLEFRSTDMVVRVSDNGVGFDPLQQLERSSGGFGLIGMRERVREIEGVIQINSRVGHGAEVVVTAPGGSTDAIAAELPGGETDLGTGAITAHPSPS